MQPSALLALVLAQNYQARVGLHLQHRVHHLALAHAPIHLLYPCGPGTILRARQHLAPGLLGQLAASGIQVAQLAEQCL